MVIRSNELGRWLAKGVSPVGSSQSPDHTRWVAFIGDAVLDKTIGPRFAPNDGRSPAEPRKFRTRITAPGKSDAPRRTLEDLHHVYGGAAHEYVTAWRLSRFLRSNGHKAGDFPPTTRSTSGRADY